MRALVYPEDATDATVVWSIEPGTGNAEINESTGLLKGTAVGNVIVQATAHDNPDIVGTLTVTIKAIPVTGIVVTSENNVTSISNGSTLQMSAKVLPGNATNPSVIWSVETGTGTATISPSGELRGTSLGTVTVKA
ncbi:Ig-like domain-containing protein, partial [Paenibacillus allorhizoplanae]|uniref:Ig-like domain-containing protein n=1 Tax=Paenibacillus allorhizoplanae TaxID=2905648 RepID=UPI001F341C9A